MHFCGDWNSTEYIPYMEFYFNMYENSTYYNQHNENQIIA